MFILFFISPTFNSFKTPFDLENIFFSNKSASVILEGSKLCFFIKFSINPDKIKEADLFEKKILSKNKGQLKLLGVGKLDDKINIEISYASKTAIQKVEKAGGTITLIKK